VRPSQRQIGHASFIAHDLYGAASKLRITRATAMKMNVGPMVHRASRDVKNVFKSRHFEPRMTATRLGLQSLSDGMQTRF
jgi:hypothetical protein